MAAIELDGLSKRYGDVLAVDGLDLEVEEGEIFGFLGPNGAGKSTTIDILLDFVRPTSGSATVLGLDAQVDSLRVRERIGVLPDAFHVYDRLTGRQHLQFVVDSKGLGTESDIDEVMERVSIAEAADRKAGGYSKGMRQRLVLAMALLGDPDLLILDEPSTGLDPNGARQMREIIRAENDRGTTVFFSSHIMEQVEAICDRVAIINRGRLVAVDSIDGLRGQTETVTTLAIDVDGADAADAADAEAIRNRIYVTSATLEGDRLEVTLTRDGSKFAVLKALDERGVEIRDFSIDESSLEDLFAEYTTEKQEVPQ
ncbi:ABC transporter ATP-binding protein [Halosimplex rubrum]|uniref:ABC transporter ATP-binding protein n=1 Tax=Halosimplex rubrum TaxID=869889 RepID=A0A7D5PCX9_9EURY|nr:ABC transporter ATP-binding protein [Halosimplex rubrum]QLH79679.1 ABC transporter ATP-binding protein [Halosimplex rubrum]